MTETLQNPVICWFRQDLRLSDNPALLQAVNSGKPVVALYIFDEMSPEFRPMGAAQKWWLHHSLSSLSKNMDALGGRLILKSGAAEDVVDQIATESGAETIYWNRRYGEPEQAVDASIKSKFKGEARSFAGLIMHEPSKVRTGAGKPYKVYTPFWKNFSAGEPPRLPQEKPSSINGYPGDLQSDALDDWKLLPTKPDWSGGLREEWTPGEAGAHERLQDFLKSDIDLYDDMRDIPAPDRTSKLSPHLRFGEVSPYQLWHASFSSDAQKNLSGSAREKWRKELVWREFSYHLLQEWPDLATNNFNPTFNTFPWDKDYAEKLTAWQTGQTGYPIVDAGMRQLYQTGWMHNRVRMIVGSFLVKHLLIDWREGEKWFWDTLVDGDPASNPASWQWVAGTGADAAPYFRIFNPILQAEKFDKAGSYIKQYVPELRDLDPVHLSAPWNAPLTDLSRAGVTLGKNYPLPIVDHKLAREKALDALNQNKDLQQTV